MLQRITNIIAIFGLLVQFLLPVQAMAASPSAPYFELCVAPSSGGDCSGDGNGTLNTFYVGQTFSAQIRLSTGGTNTKSANVIINYDTNYLTVNDSKPGTAGTQILAGSLYESYPDSGNTVSGGIIKLTGANTSGANYNGTGIFGTISFTVTAQKVTPLDTTFNFTPGSTIDSNIVRSGDSADILNAVENSQWNLFPDTGKPYLDTLNYPDGSTGVPVESNIVFHLRDNETGVNTSTVNVLVQEGTGDEVNRNAWVVASCSGLWGTNDCTMTLNPADVGNRNWNYNTSYTVTVRDGQDKASVTQAPPGPNAMEIYVFTFTTEADADAPTLSNETPTGNSEPVNTNITFRVSDVKTSVATLGTQGTGVNSATISIDVTSGSGLINYSCGDGNTTCTPLVSNSLTYGYDISIDPTADFAQNEQVLITVKNVADNSSPAHVMPNYNWSFWTVDLTGPTVTDWNPVKGANNLAPNTPITFHVQDSGVGVDINTLSIRIGEDIYTLLGENSFDYTGDASDYAISVTPVTSFESDKPIAISINVSDNSGNALTPEDLYAVVYDTDPIAETCPTCPDCTAKGGSNESCTSSGTSTSSVESIIERVTEVPVDRIVEKLVEKPQNIADIRSKINALDDEFKGKVQKATAVLKINNRSIKDIEYPFYVYSGRYITVSGRTVPHANVSVIMYSNALIEKTTSDSKGDWSVRFVNDFTPTFHPVFLDISKEQANSGYLYGAKIYIVPLWAKILVPILGLSILTIIFTMWWRWKKKRTKKSF